MFLKKGPILGKATESYAAMYSDKFIAISYFIRYSSCINTLIQLLILPTLTKEERYTMQLFIEDLAKSFQEKTVLEGLNHTFEEGKIYALLGRNGAGKTTLFNILYGELSADRGGFGLIEEGQKHPLLPQDIAMVFADNYLPDFLTGYEFIKFLLDLHGSPDGLTPDQYLDMVKIPQEDRGRIIKDYSSGMQSKLSLLTTIILQPKVILLDEPLTSVDVVVGIQLKHLLKDLKPGRIIILSTHILQLAMDMADEVVLLKNGYLQGFSYRGDRDAYEEALISELAEEGEWRELSAGNPYSLPEEKLPRENGAFSAASPVGKVPENPLGKE